MASTHGKKSKLYIASVPGGGTTPVALTPVGFTLLSKASAASLAFSKDIADASTMGMEDRESESGQKGSSVTVQFRYKASELLIMQAAYESDTPSLVVYRPAGDVVGGLQFVAAYHIQEINISGSNGDVVNGSITFQRTGSTTTSAIV